MNVITKIETLLGTSLIGLGVVGGFIEINKFNAEFKKIEEITKIKLKNSDGFAYNCKTDIRLGDIIKDLPDNDELNKFFNQDDLVNITCLIQKK